MNRLLALEFESSDCLLMAMGMIPHRSSDSEKSAIAAIGGGAKAHVTLEEVNPEDTALPEDTMLLGGGPTSELMAALRPEALTLDEFANYLRKRTSFLRDLIALDYRHAKAEAQAVPAATGSDLNRAPEADSGTTSAAPTGLVDTPNTEGRSGELDLAHVVFDSAGNPLQQMTGATVQAPQSPHQHSPRPVPAAVSPDHVASDLTELLPAVPHALIIVPHRAVVPPESRSELTRTEIQRVEKEVPASRQVPTLARLVAARRAAEAFARRHRDTILMPTHISVAHLDNGSRPELRWEDVALEPVFSGADLSLAGGPGISVAVIAEGSVGAGWHPVQRRSAEDWRGLLGDEGYSLALAVAPETGESFDCAATRVRALLKAGKNASLKEMVLALGERLGGSYLSFNAVANGDAYKLISALVQPQRPAAGMAVLAVLFGNKNTQTKAV